MELIYVTIIILQNLIPVVHQTANILTAIYVISETKSKEKKKKKEMQTLDSLHLYTCTAP